MPAAMNATAHDFPDWLGPIVVKQLRQGLRAPAFEWSFVLLQMSLVLALSIGAATHTETGSEWSEIISVVLMFVLGVQLLVVTPARALAELSGERKVGTLDLLLLSGLSPRRLVFGKWSAHLFQASLCLVAVLPYAVARYFLGKVDLLEDLRVIVIQIALCALLSACALALSTDLRRKIVFGCTALGVGLLWFGNSFRLVREVAESVEDFFRFASAAIKSPFACGLLVVDVGLVCFAALELAARTIAPVADNPVVGKRAVALLAALPLPLMSKAGADPKLLLFQVAFALAACLILCARDLFAAPLLLRSWCRGFRPGARALLGMLFLPGGPSSALFLSLLAVLGLVSLQFPSARALGDSVLYLLVELAIGMLGVCLIAAILRVRRVKLPGLLAVFLLATPTMLVPRVGLAVVAQVIQRPVEWALAGFVIHGGLLLVGARSYWRSYFEICRAAQPVSPA